MRQGLLFYRADLQIPPTDSIPFVWLLVVGDIGPRIKHRGGFMSPQVTSTGTVPRTNQTVTLSEYVNKAL
jgi:hypothetical protein